MPGHFHSTIVEEIIISHSFRWNKSNLWHDISKLDRFNNSLSDKFSIFRSIKNENQKTRRMEKGKTHVSELINIFQYSLKAVNRLRSPVGYIWRLDCPLSFRFCRFLLHSTFISSWKNLKTKNKKQYTMN